jgi:hypothetical protein
VISLNVVGTIVDVGIRQCFLAVIEIEIIEDGLGDTLTIAQLSRALEALSKSL